MAAGRRILALCWAFPLLLATAPEEGEGCWTKLTDAADGTAEEMALHLLQRSRRFQLHDALFDEMQRQLLLPESSRRTALLQKSCGEPCRTTAPSPVGHGSGRTYVFIMGIEGAGHHAVCPLVQLLLQQAGYNVSVSPINMFGRTELLPWERWRKKFLKETKSWCPDGVCLNCLDSFPYSRPTLASASPDFARMARLHELKDIDLRVVAITRNLTSAIFSSMRRFPSDTVQAIAFSKHFVTEVVRNTEAWSKEHCERLGTLRYEDLVEEPQSVVGSVSKALGLKSSQSGKLAVLERYHEQLHGSHGDRYRARSPAFYDKVSGWLREHEPFLWPELQRLWCS